MRIAIVASILVALASPARAQVCGDPNGDGRVTVSDGVDVLRASVALSNACTLAICDVDGNGTVSVTDGVLVLRTAVQLPTDLACNLDARQTCLATIRAGNLAASADTCAAAAAADPDDATVQAMADASSTVVATLDDPELTEVLFRLGIVRAGSAANVCDILIRRRGSFPPSSPRTGEIVAVLHGRGLELIEGMLASVADVPTDASFQFSCPSLAEEGLVVEIDYGDLLVARYELEFVAALIHIAAAYNTDFDFDAAVNGDASFRDVLVGNPSLFTFDGGSGAAELGLARNRLDAALAGFIAAVDFIEAESDDQSNDLFVVSPGDASTIARERAGAVRLRAALNGTARFEASIFDLPRDQRLTLDRFLDGKIASLRELVPGFDEDGDVDLCKVEDPTFGDVLPDLTTDGSGCIDPNSLDFVGGRFAPFFPRQ